MLWTFNQHNFAGGRLDKELMGRQDLTQYFKGCSELRNFSVRRQGNLAKRRGTNLAADLSSLTIAKYRLVPLVYSKEEGFYLLLTGGRIYLASKDGVRTTSGTFTRNPTSANVYSIASGVTDARIDDIDFCQTGDTVFFVHHELPPFKVEFYRNEVKDGDGNVTHAALSLSRSDISFDVSAVSSPSILSLERSTGTTWPSTGASKVVSYKVTIVDSNGTESYPSDSKSATFKLPWPDSGTFKIKVYDNSGQAKPSKYNIYKNYGSGYGWIGAIPSAEITDVDTTGKYSNYGEFSDDYITPDMSLTPPEIENRRLFNVAGEYPSVVSLYQQRLVLGCSDRDPFTFWMSCTGDLYNFSTHATLREDDAITATLAATEQPEILHALLAKELMLFANSGEWTVSPVSGNALSYKTVSAKMQSAIGTARCTKPFVIGDEIVFLDSSCERLLATRYNFATDGYESQELTVMSQWMFRNNAVRRMAYRSLPDSTIHCVMADGTIAVMVYMKEHEVCAWTRVDLGGGYLAKDVACSKALSRGSTDVMYLVQNATTNRYELWSERDDMPVRDVNALADFLCMDGMRELAAGSVVPAGMVAVAKDGGNMAQEGATLSKASHVGYPFLSKFESVNPDAKGDGESTQMEIQNATETKVRTIDSSTFKVGACSANESTDSVVKAVPSCIGGNVVLRDVDARVLLTGRNAKDGRIRITHDGVFPLNILSVATTYQIETANQNGGGNG